jgi:hypothetical protein
MRTLPNFLPYINALFDELHGISRGRPWIVRLSGGDCQSVASDTVFSAGLTFGFFSWTIQSRSERGALVLKSNFFLWGQLFTQWKTRLHMLRVVLAYAYVKSCVGLHIEKLNLSKHPIRLLFLYVHKIHPAVSLCMYSDERRQTAESEKLSGTVHAYGAFCWLLNERN